MKLTTLGQKVGPDGPFESNHLLMQSSRLFCTDGRSMSQIRWYVPRFMLASRTELLGTAKSVLPYLNRRIFIELYAMEIRSETLQGFEQLLLVLSGI